MRTRIAAAMLLAGCAGSASAADWSIDPRITLSGESDDNHRLSAVPGDEISVTGYELDARLTMRARTPRSSFRLVPRVRVAAYPGEEDDDTEDGFLNLNWEFRGEKSVGALIMDYAHRTVLGRYYSDSPVPDDGGLGEPGQGSGSGSTTFPTDQDDLRIKPRATFNLTERTALLLRAGYQDVKFDDQVFNDRVDFTNVDGGAGLQFRTSPTADISFLAGVRRYEPEDNFASDTQFLVGEWSNAISDVSQVYVRGGGNRSKQDGVPGADWQTGFNGGAGVKWGFEVTDLFLELNHYIDPSASGRIVNRDQFRAEVVRRFSERTALSFAARAIRDADTGDDDTFQTREYISAGVSYEWRFTRQFSLLAGYDYTWREYEDDPSAAESNRFFLGVSWEPNRTGTESRLSVD